MSQKVNVQGYYEYMKMPWGKLFYELAEAVYLARRGFRQPRILRMANHLPEAGAL